MTELEEKQDNCPYCHEPFLDFSGKASDEVDYDDKPIVTGKQIGRAHV